MTNEYKSQAARDAAASGYGSASYWDRLDRSALDARDYYRRHPELGIDPETMLTRSLSDALMGNDGV